MTVYTMQGKGEAQRESRGVIYSSFNLCARWGWVASAVPQPFSPWERSSTCCIGSWLGRMVCLDGCGKSHPYQDLIP
jgi:hypothetical protein